MMRPSAEIVSTAIRSGVSVASTVERRPAQARVWPQYRQQEEDGPSQRGGAALWMFACFSA